MGGQGSGRWIRWDARATTDQCHRLALHGWTQHGWLRPGAQGIVRWLRGDRETGTIGWIVTGQEQNSRERRPAALLLHYQVRGEPVCERIALTWTACSFGGQRPWWCCPGCGRRCAVLYGGIRFRCRRCHDLAYASTREEPYERALRRSQAIRQRLGGSPNLLAPFPPKPPRMHWRTYLRLAEEAMACEAAWGAGLAARLEQTIGDATGPGNVRGVPAGLRPAGLLSKEET